MVTVKTLAVDFDPNFGKVTAVKSGSNVVINVTPLAGADFKDWTATSFNSLCNPKQTQCTIPVSTLIQAGSNQPRLKANLSGGQAYLLLHGMNSTVWTWNNIEAAMIRNTWSNQCLSITATSLPAINANTRCFRLQASNILSGYNARTKKYQAWLNGDGLTFWQLGSEVISSLRNIQNNYPGIRSFVLVGHSRGGLDTDGDGVVHIQSEKALPAAQGVSNYSVYGVHHAGEPSASSVFQQSINALYTFK